MKNINYINNQALASDNDFNSVAALAAFIPLTKKLFSIFKDVGKRQKEYKFYLGAKVREARYSNRYEVYKHSLDFVNLHNKIFTSSYNVFLYQKMNDSSDFLYFAIEDIFTYEIQFNKDEK
jgi:hypothetical protein